jgi:hypothetical protein
VCNFTNAIFFWALLPETSKVPLEAMDNLWENAPWFVPTMRRKDYLAELEQHKEEIEEKQATVHVTHLESTA